MIKMHLIWKYNPLGREPAERGVSLVEIDESKIVANQNIIFWMFGIIDIIYDTEAQLDNFKVINDIKGERVLELDDIAGPLMRRDKACRVFCVKDNRIKESFLPLLKENVIINEDIIINNYNSNI